MGPTQQATNPTQRARGFDIPPEARNDLERERERIEYPASLLPFAYYTKQMQGHQLTPDRRRELLQLLALTLSSSHN